MISKLLAILRNSTFWLINLTFCQTFLMLFLLTFRYLGLEMMAIETLN
jgi:hypothetical protein